MQSSALNASNCKKNRKRNFVPASVSILAMVLLLVYTPIAAFLIYQSEEYDNGTRAFIWSAITDIFFCVICPGAVLYGAPSVRWRWKIRVRPVTSGAQQDKVDRVKTILDHSGPFIEKNIQESEF